MSDVHFTFDEKARILTADVPSSVFNELMEWRTNGVKTPEGQRVGNEIADEILRRGACRVEIRTVYMGALAMQRAIPGDNR